MEKNILLSTRGFVGGMDKDLDDSVLGENKYRDARNFRIISEDGGKSGSLQNILGNVRLDVNLTSPDKYFLTYKLTSTQGPTNTAELLNSIVFQYGAQTYSLFFVYKYAGNNTVLTSDQIMVNIVDAFNSGNSYCTANPWGMTAVYGSGIISIESPFSLVNSLAILTPPAPVLPATLFSSSFSFNKVYSGHQDHKIVGYCEIDNYLYLITCKEPANGTGSVFKIEFDDSEIPPVTSVSHIWSGDLNTSLSSPVRKAIGVFERDDIHKIFYTDYNNYLRVINTKDIVLSTRTASSFDVIPDAMLFEPKVVDVLGGGSLKAGVIQYAYSLYNINGAQTVFSPASRLVPLTEEQDVSSGTKYYIGSELGDNTRKSVSIMIGGDAEEIDLRFSNIVVVAIHYDRIFGVPSINVLYDGKIPGNGRMSLTDTGSDYIGVISIDEYNNYGNRLFKARDIETKNNYLIAFNVKDELFDVDFDARAYRYNSSGATYLNVATVKEEDDCINPDPYVFNKKAGGSAIYGGTGPNVEFEFVTVPLEENNSAVFSHTYGQTLASQPWSTILGADYVDNNSYSGFASPINASQFVGYMRDESYRFGLVFKDKKGRSSFVKWIADIKMPAAWEIDGKDHTGSPIEGNRFWTFERNAFGGVNVYPLGLKFSVDIPQNIADSVDSFEIVRVKRSSSDRSILAQGVVGPGVYNAVDGKYYGTLNTHGYTDTIIGQFWAPNYVITDDFHPSKGNVLEVISVPTYLQIPDGVAGFDEYISRYHQVYNPLVTQPGPTNMPTYRRGITDFVKTDAGDDSYDLSTVGVSWGPPSTLPSWKGASSVVFALNGTIPSPGIGFQIPLVGWEGYGWLANWKQTDATPYGGGKYENRLNNIYQSCGIERKISGAGKYDVIVFGGDTYITFFDFLYSIYRTADFPNGQFGAIYCPIESQINMNLRTADSMHNKVYNKTDYPFLQETAGQYELGSFTPSVYYTQDKDLYRYNTVYSQENTARTFFPKRPTDRVVDHNRQLIIASQKKTNGEIIDSWTRFLPADFLEVSSRYGEIAGVGVAGNYLLCFQEGAVGVPQIEEKAVIFDNQATEIVLGTGRVLSRLDYLTTTSGTSHQFSIISTPSAVHYFDYNQKNWRAISGQDLSLSNTLGMKSYFANNFVGEIYNKDNPHIGEGISSYYDRRFGEAIMSFFDTPDGSRTPETETISYSELLNAYNGFYDYSSPIYIVMLNKVLSIERVSQQSDRVWMHNIGSPAEFYGVKYKSTFHYLVNDSYGNTKVYDSIKIPMESHSPAGINLTDDFLNRVRCYNGHQNSDWHTIRYKPVVPPTGKNIEVTRRERNWLMHIPRNFVGADYQTNPDIFDPANLANINRLFKERMRSQALNIQFEYDNLDNNLINIPFAITRYRVSDR